MGSVANRSRRFPWVLDEGDYDHFTKMKEPLWGTRYNAREEINRAVGLSRLDITRSGRADGVRCLLEIRQKVAHMGGGNYIEGMEVCLPQVLKS
jgi:hypothetical protein